MSTPIQRSVLCLVRRMVLGLMIAVLAAAGAPCAAAVEVPEKDHFAVFDRGQNAHRFAVLETPKGAGIGAGTPVQIQAFGIRIAAIDGPQLVDALRRLPELDRGVSQFLPPGFKVYADSRYVLVAYAGASHKYTITLTSPADVTGTGRGRGEGGSAGGSGSGGGGAM